MSRNIDVLAIGLVLFGIVFITQARRSAAVERQSTRLVQFTSQRIQPFLARPHVPRLCLTRD